METKKNINNSFYENQSRSHSQVERSPEAISERIDRAYFDDMTFSEAFVAVKEQVEFFAFSDTDKTKPTEFVLSLPKFSNCRPASMVRIRWKQSSRRNGASRFITA